MRYLPLTPADREAMLATIGAASIDDLYRDVPKEARLDGLVDLPLHMGEMEVERRLGAMAARNVPAGAVPSFLGAGAYRHHVPASVDHLIQRGEFLTSYTPYQPEISQGTLQYLFEFQTQVALITGMDVANASMYDGATACAEAVMMANRVTRRSRASGEYYVFQTDTQSGAVQQWRLRGTRAGRATAEETTCFLNNLGIGLQFAAVGAVVFKEAKARGVGREIPTDWFLESVHP
jgi:glycine cleavage system pyridoxal-binding protein P